MARMIPNTPAGPAAPARLRACRMLKSLPDACALWRIADVVVRATNTDGNPLMVQEALWCGVPVVASDCVPRDPEVVTFRSRRADDLAAKLSLVLGDLPGYRETVSKMQHADNAGKLIGIYRDLLQQGAR